MGPGPPDVTGHRKFGASSSTSSFFFSPFFLSPPPPSSDLHFYGLLSRCLSRQLPGIELSL